MDSENLKVTKREATKRNLTDRLSLGRSGTKEFKTYLAYLAHPQGGTTIMEAYKIISENSEGYELGEIPDEEMRILNRKYSQGAGSTFTVSGRINQEI